LFHYAGQVIGALRFAMVQIFPKYLSTSNYLLLAQSKMNSDGIFHQPHIRLGQNTKLAF
jgi:hypothetical protein